MTFSVSAPTNNTGALLNNGTEVLSIDSSNNVSVPTNNVGIGTTTPDSRLHIKAGTNALRTITLEDTASGAKTEIMSAVSGGQPRLAFKTAGSEKMRIDENGYITMPNQPSAQFGFDYGNNLGTSGDNYVNSSWSFDFPFTPLVLSNRGITVVNDGTRDSRITVPVSGRYEINIDLFLNITSSLRAFAPRLLRNGVTIKSFGWDSFTHVSGTTHPHAGYTFIVDANANDYFTVQVTAYDSPSSYLLNANSMLTIKMIG